MSRIIITILNNIILLLNFELEICIFGANIHYMSLFVLHRQTNSLQIININLDTYHTRFFGNMKNFKFALPLLPLHSCLEQ